MRDAEVCRGVWAALEGRPRTLDELEMVTGLGMVDITDYVAFLIEHGYVTISGTRKAHSGEAIPILRVIRWTGPQAPHDDKRGRLVDPNRQAQKAVLFGDGADLPTIYGRIRQWGGLQVGAFTRDELAEHLGISAPEGLAHLKTAINRLRFRRELVTVDRNTFSYYPSPALETVRQWFAAHPREDIRGDELGRWCSAAKQAQTVRNALDVLAAAGWKIRITAVSTKRTDYRVIPPRGWKQ